MQESPYEYYDGKLGLKIKYLVYDKSGDCEPHQDSIKIISYHALKQRMSRNSSCEKRLRRAALNNDTLILFSSISREWKDRLTIKFGNPKEEIKESWFAQHYEADRKSYEFYVGHRYGEKNEKKLDLKLVETYTYNASVLNAVLEMKTNRRAYAKALGGVQLDIWQSLSNDVNAFREVAHDLPATRDGLRRKANKYKKEGFISLISGRLQNINASKTKGEEQMAMLDELLSKHTNLDNQLISEIYNAVAKQLGWDEITPMTVSNRKNKKKVTIHAGRNGIKSLKSNVLMQVKRSKPTTPMLYWTLDGWDVELLYQDTSVDKKGNKVTTYHNRLTVVVVLDPHNNYPVGYAIGTNESPALIKKALQNSMRHVNSLFGELYMPYQLQSDNYAVKNLTPIYKAITPHFTPAEVGNAKAKVIEPYFGYINKKYCKLLDNWSGHNVDSGSKNQPNSEYLQKIKKQFPDQNGCISQIEALISSERSKKQEEYQQNWLETKEEFKQIMSLENYLLTFGSSTGDTNKLTGEGVVIKIEGEKCYFDSFDLNFRHQSHLDWSIQYDTNDLSQVLAVSDDGTERHLLEQKYIQPMALADRTEKDPFELKRIKDFNKTTIDIIVDERASNSRLLDTLLDRPELNDTLAKHLLTDSVGQHKNHKSRERLEVAKNSSQLVEKTAKKEEKKQLKTFADEQQEYYDSKVNINEYIS
jgi:hypothetical protein